MSALESVHQIDKLYTLLEKLLDPTSKAVTIPIAREVARHEKMQKILNIFQEFANVATTLPNSGPNHLRVLYDPSHLHDFNPIGLSKSFDLNVDDTFEVIFGILCGNEHGNGKGPSSFFGNIQIRFYAQKATIMPHYCDEFHSNCESFKELIMEFLETKNLERINRNDELRANLLSGTGTEFELSINEALHFANEWRNMLQTKL